MHSGTVKAEVTGAQATHKGNGDFVCLLIILASLYNPMAGWGELPETGVGRAVTRGHVTRSYINYQQSLGCASVISSSCSLVYSILT